MYNVGFNFQMNAAENAVRPKFCRVARNQDKSPNVVDVVLTD